MVRSPEWTASEGVPKSDHTTSFYGRTAQLQPPNTFFIAVFCVRIGVNGNLPGVAAAACRTVFCDAFEFIENGNPLYLHRVCSFDELLGTAKRCLSIVPILDILSLLEVVYNNFSPRYCLYYLLLLPHFHHAIIRKSIFSFSQIYHICDSKDSRNPCFYSNQHTNKSRGIEG